MAAFVSDFVSWTTTAGNKSVSVTTPSVGDIIVVCSGQSATNSVGTISDDQTGGTYTAIVTETRSGTVGSITWFIRDALVSTTSTHVVTFTSPGSDTGGGLSAILVSGMSRAGASAARQFQTVQNGTAGSTPAPAFDAACLTGNMILGAGINATNPFGSAAPSGATERRDVGYTTPNYGLHTWTRDSGFTGTTCTYGATSASAFSIVIMELDTSAATASMTLGMDIGF